MWDGPEIIGLLFTVGAFVWNNLVTVLYTVATAPTRSLLLTIYLLNTVHYKPGSSVKLE